MPRAFFDTNVVVYAFTDDRRSLRAQDVIGRGGVISVQVLNEFAHVARRKLAMSWVEIREALAAVRVLCPTVVALDCAIHERALDLAENHRLSVFDSLIVAAALDASCSTLWTEDMQDGMTVENRLTFVNPFRDP